jgi:hypothetical protein
MKGRSDSQKSGKLVDIESEYTQFKEHLKYKDDIPKDLKYLKYLKPKKNYFGKNISYNKLYELLHEEIQQFNYELDQFKIKNSFLFEELIQNIETIIKNKFPGDY